jgi:hypothetical protein
MLMLLGRPLFQICRRRSKRIQFTRSSDCDTLLFSRQPKRCRSHTVIPVTSAFWDP